LIWLLAKTSTKMKFLRAVAGTGLARALQSWGTRLGLFSFVLLCLAVVVLGSCRKSDSSANAVDEALAETMSAMHSAMRDVSMDGRADADFARMMIPHHQGAIEMAKVELQFGVDPVLRRLAQEIIVTQLSEIDVMNLALKKYPLTAKAKNNWCFQ
jgi:Domain of unknown function (DUF305)